MDGFDVVDFRVLAPTDPYSLRWKNWSRAYEYEYVLRKLDAAQPRTVHNTAAGRQIGCHYDFAWELDARFESVLHSDLFPTPGSFANYRQYDILDEPTDDMRFDAVVCVSTLEHVKGDRRRAFDNLCRQVNPGGVLVVTFDVPDQSLEEMSGWVGVECDVPPVRLNGVNSVLPKPMFERLNVGVLTLQARWTHHRHCVRGLQEQG